MNDKRKIANQYLKNYRNKTIDMSKFISNIQSENQETQVMFLNQLYEQSIFDKNLLDKFLNSQYSQVRKAIVKFLYAEHLDTLIHDKNNDVREEVLKLHRQKDLDEIIENYLNMKSKIIDIYLSYGINEAIKHLDRLGLKYAAIYGDEKTLDILCDCIDSNIRYHVAVHGRLCDKEKLGADSNNFIRKTYINAIKKNKQVNDIRKGIRKKKVNV